MRGSHHIARAAAIAVVALLAAAPVIAAPAPSISGVAADMTLDAARAAAPTVQWQNELSPHTGKPVAIWADAAFTLEGQPYRISLRPFASGSARLRLTSDEQVPKEKMCRARVVALAAHFDAFFDKMEPKPSMFDRPVQATPTITYNRLPGGAGYVSAIPNFVDDGRDYDTLEAGRNARIQEIEYDETDDLEWTTGQRAKDDYPYALDFSASFHQGDEALPAVCHIEAVVTRYPRDREWPGRPSFDLLDTAKSKLVEKPSPAVLHSSLDGVELPPQGVSLAYRCDVNRATGKLTYCAHHQRERAAWPLERAAERRWRVMAFDTAGLDPDNDQPLRTDVTIKLSPSERLKVDPQVESGNADGTPVRVQALDDRPMPSWTRAPTSDDLSRFYPKDALRMGLEARVVATCTIADDLSLNCAAFEVNPPQHTMFEAAARNILAVYRAAPKLKNGKDAPGTMVRIPILFKLADEPPPPAP